VNEPVTPVRAALPLTGEPAADASSASPATPTAPLVDQILDLVANETRIERQLLQLDARPDALGATSLDLTLALFALEDRFDIELPDVMGGGSTLPTVGELVQQVLDAIQRRANAEMAAMAAPAGLEPVSS